MAYITYLATGWEGGVAAFYAENGWDNDFGGMASGAGQVHKTLSGAGGSYSFYTWTRMRSPAVSTNSRWLHFWQKAINTSQDMNVQFARGGLRQFSLSASATTGVVGFYNGGTPLAVTGPGVWNSATSHWIAIRLKAATAGTATLFIDGTQVLTFSGDTAEQATDDWDQFAFGSFWGIFGPMNHWVDDVIVTDDDGGAMTTPLTEAYGFPIVPDGTISGNLTGVPPWVPTTDRYKNIDELPASQTDYNLAAAANDEDLYSLTAPASGATIHAVTVWAEAGRDGTITQAAIHTVSGASDTYGTAVTLPAAPSYGVISRVHTRNPDGDVAWTNASIAALQVGLKFT